MASRVLVAVLFASALSLGGCSYTENTLWPALGFQTQGSTNLTPATQASKAGTHKPAQQQPAQQQPAQQQPVQPQASVSPAPQFTTSAPVGAAPLAGGTEITVNGDSTGTVVGHRVAQLQRELIATRQSIAGQAQQFQALRRHMVRDSEEYHGLVAAIAARLQIGTTRGNPIVVRQWQAAQGALDRLANDVGAMSTLGNRVADTSSSAAYVLHSVKTAFNLSGAVDLDHERLTELQDATERTQIGIDRLVTELNNAVSRQSAYVGQERVNLTHLATAIKNGKPYGSNAGQIAPSPVASESFDLPSAPSFGSRAALMIIRFDRPKVRYQRQLYNVMSETLKRRPQARFDLVAVAKGSGSAAQVALHQSRSRINVENVFRSMIAMGVPADRVTLSATTNRAIASDEVKIYVR